MVLAGTDTSGTTMYGLARAAQSKGLSAAGIELSVDELKPNHIVHVVIDGTAHFSVVREITETSVKLADPKLGNIEMSREKFSEIFTGHALVISNPNEYVNGTTDQTNQTDNTNFYQNLYNNSTDTNSTNVQVDSSTTLTSEQMQNIIGWGSINWHRVAYWGCIIGGIACSVIIACMFPPAGAGLLYYGLVAAGAGFAFGGAYLGDPYYGDGWHM